MLGFAALGEVALAEVPGAVTSYSIYMAVAEGHDTFVGFLTVSGSSAAPTPPSGSVASAYVSIHEITA